MLLKFKRFILCTEATLGHLSLSSSLSVYQSKLDFVICTWTVFSWKFTEDVKTHSCEMLTCLLLQC